MTKNKLVNQGAVRRVYRQIILLGMLVHVLYVALFGGLGMSGMVYYNVGSTVFYMAMLVLVFYGRYRMAVTLIHLEVCVFSAGNRRICVFEDGLGSRRNGACHFRMPGKRRLFV